MLPNTNNLPFLLAQLATNTPVTFPVVGYFGIPKLLITAWPFVALWAAVPETTVHKNDNAFASKVEIRFAKKQLAAPPTGNMELTKNLNQAQLRRHVSARANE